ncbi:MAG: type 1 glutamine amidotransferase, partial [Cycloclasticus sp.]
MHIHVLHHVHLPIKHGIVQYLDNCSHTVSHTYLCEDHKLPDSSTIDLLIIMGGIMSANNEDKHPWLIAEKTFIKSVIDAGKAVFGICLGSQLIACALGAKVTKNPDAEFGWHSITPSDAVKETFLADVFDKEMTFFHSHGETFDIPTGATRLASSKACKNQGFIYDNRVVAIQFHPEITPELAKLFTDHLDSTWTNSPFCKVSVDTSIEQQLFRQSA